MVMMPAEPPDNIEEKMLALKDQVEERCAPLGLYLRGLGLRPPDEHPPDMVVVLDFTLGDLAFSDRVQNPEREQINRQVAEMTDELGDSTGETLRQHWIDKGVLRPRDDE